MLLAGAGQTHFKVHFCTGCVKKLALMDRRLITATECVGQPACLQLAFLSMRFKGEVGIHVVHKMPYEGTRG